MSDAEHRRIRPYRGLRNCQKAFDQIGLHVGTQVIKTSQKSLEPSEFLEDKIKIEFAASPSEFREFLEILDATADDLEIRRADLGIAVIGVAAGRREAEVLLACGLDSAYDSLTHLHLLAEKGDRPDVMSDPRSELRLEIYFILKKEIDRRPLVPSRKGTWLAARVFILHTKLATEGLFRPIPLTDELRGSLELEPGVIRYADFQNPTDPTVSDDDMRFYLDEALYRQLQESEGTPGSRLIQQELFLNVVSAIIYRSAIELAGIKGIPQLADIDGSILNRILDRVATGEDGDVEDGRKALYFNMVREDPAKFVTLFESSLTPAGARTRGLSKEMVSLAKGSD